LFVAGEQACTLPGELFLAVAQAAIFFGKPAHGIEQAIEPLAQGGQLLLDRVNVIRRAHARNYNRTPAEISVVIDKAEKLPPLD